MNNEMYRINPSKQIEWDYKKENWVRYYTIQKFEVTSWSECIINYIVACVCSFLGAVIAYIITNYKIGIIVFFACLISIIIVMTLQDDIYPKERWIKSEHGKFYSKKGVERYVKGIGRKLIK
ncbi:MAG: hypothetical protein ACOCVF_02925 [bacterium]